MQKKFETFIEISDYAILDLQPLWLLGTSVKNNQIPLMRDLAKTNLKELYCWIQWCLHIFKESTEHIKNTSLPSIQIDKYKICILSNKVQLNQYNKFSRQKKIVSHESWHLQNQKMKKLKMDMKVVLRIDFKIKNTKIVLFKRNPNDVLQTPTYVLNSNFKILRNVILFINFLNVIVFQSQGKG